MIAIKEVETDIFRSKEVRITGHIKQ